MFHSRCHIGCDYGVVNRFVEVGALAMTGFFMLSGFALWKVYSEVDLTTWPAIRRFYLKRIISLWPVMIVVGYSSVLYRIFCGSWSALKAALLLPIELLGLTTTFNGLFGLSHIGGTWFISCIFICYLLFPLLMIVLRALRTVERIGVLALFGFLIFWTPLIVKTFPVASVYASPFFRFYEFACGAALAALLPNVAAVLKKLRMDCAVATLGVVILHVVFITFVCHFMRAQGQSAYVYCSAASLPFYGLLICQLSTLGLHSARVVPYLGALSFSFYMAQTFCFRITKVFVRHGMTDNICKIAMSFVVCVVLSVMLYHFVQCPAKRYLSRKLGCK